MPRLRKPPVHFATSIHPPGYPPVGNALRAVSPLAAECRGLFSERGIDLYSRFEGERPAMLRFRRLKTLQKLASAQANVHNHFNHAAWLHEPSDRTSWLGISRSKPRAPAIGEELRLD